MSGTALAAGLAGHRTYRTEASVRSEAMSSDSSKAVESFDFLEPAGQPDEIGRLGPYRVLKLLGTGGMGHVFLAEDSRLRRSVALKVMNKRIAAGSGSRRRFLQEARSMAAVDHDNVVTIYEVGERNGVPFLAMELLKGSTLEELLDAGEPFDVDRVVTLAIGICHGLQAAHDRGIIHRDIKPGNIWIESPSGRPKLLDFGLALATGPVEQIAGAGSVTGTPGYLSPEQARVEPLDNRSDLYGLGVVLFEICTGRLPFVTKPAQRMLIAVIANAPPLAHELNPDVPLPLSSLIDRLLSKEARDRPASADTLAALFEEIAEPSSTDSPTTAGPRWRWTVGLVGLAVLLVTALVWAVTANFFSGIAEDQRGGQMTRPASPRDRQAVTVESLRPLQIEGLTVADDSVPVGENLTVTFFLKNEASGGEFNPARIYADRDVVARVSVYLQPEGGARAPADAFPLRRSPTQLPRPGRRREQTILVGTGNAEPGRYSIAAVLETPDGTFVSEAATNVTLTMPN